MNRLLSTLSVAVLAATASAQCFESNFGTSLGLGDDTLFAAQPMNINFPMGGAFATYDHIRVNTNGCAFLWSGATGELNTTSTGYSSTESTMISNLRGTAGGAPRIAPYWRDLNFLAGNSGQVWINNTIPGKCVITWQNAVHYSNNPPIFTFQAQLFDTGVVQFFYSGTAQNYNTVPICGISQGGAIADPGVTDLSVGATGVSTSPIVYQTFTVANTFDLQATSLSFVPNAGGGYDVFPSSCVPATSVNYGAGCGSAKEAFYENFGTSAAFDLANSGVSMFATGTGYSVQPLTTTYVPPSGTAAVLALTDDSEVTVALTNPLAFPGGSTSALTVCSNGFVSAASGNGTSFTPSVSTLLNGSQCGWYTWHDFNPAAAGSGSVKFEEIGSVAYVTWDGVYNFSGTNPATDASTIQYQFDTATGNVHIVFGTMTTTGNGFLVGHSPAGNSVDPGNLDLTTALPLTTSPDIATLALSVNAAPILGTTVTWTTSNINAGAVLTAQLISLGQVDPGLPITGAPGCVQLVDLSLAATVLLFNNPIDSYSIALPSNPAFVGLPLNCQSASLVPAANALGVVTSNGVRSVANTF